MGGVSDVETVSGDDDLVGILDTPQVGPKVIRGMAIRGLGYAVSVLLGVISAAIALRYLGVVDSGRLITVFAIVTIAGGVSDVGLSSLAVREYATTRPFERDDFMRNILPEAGASPHGHTRSDRVRCSGAVSGGNGGRDADHETGATGWGRAAEPCGLALRIAAFGLGDRSGPAGLHRRCDRVHRPLLGRRRSDRVLCSSSAGTNPGARRHLCACPGTVPVQPAWMLGVWRRTVRDILPDSVGPLASSISVSWCHRCRSLPGEETGYYAASFRLSTR